MGFFDALRRVLGPSNPPGTAAPPAVEEGAPADLRPRDAGAYDHTQWRKKLKRILEELPTSRAEWDELQYEARALELDPGWIEECQREEFLLLVRRAVCDRVVTEAEHRKLDLARELIGMPEPEAEATLLLIVAEAESFFGKPVREGG